MPQEGERKEEGGERHACLLPTCAFHACLPPTFHPHSILLRAVLPASAATYQRGRTGITHALPIPLLPRCRTHTFAHTTLPHAWLGAQLVGVAFLTPPCRTALALRTTGAAAPHLSRPSISDTTICTHTLHYLPNTTTPFNRAAALLCALGRADARTRTTTRDGQVARTMRDCLPTFVPLPYRHPTRFALLFSRRNNLTGQARLWASPRGSNALRLPKDATCYFPVLPQLLPLSWRACNSWTHTRERAGRW